MIFCNMLFCYLWETIHTQKEITVVAQLLKVILPSQIALCPSLTKLYCKQLFFSKCLPVILSFQTKCCILR